MKKQFILPFLSVSVWLIVSCQNLADETTAASGEAILGTQIPFQDTPGILKVELKNVADIADGIGYYENGKRSGSWVEYDNTGMVKSVTTYLNGSKEGVALEFSTNQLTRRYYNHNNQRHGDYVEYNGVRVKEARNYVNGKMEGLTKVFYDDGKIMEEGNYENGVRHGVSKWYDQAGNVSIEYEYKNGELVKK